MIHRSFCICAAASAIALLVGCAPSPLGLRTIDAFTGEPLSNVTVEHWDKMGSKPGGVTDASGRIEGIPVSLGDKLNLSHAGYDPVRLEIGLSEAKPLRAVPQSVTEKSPHGVDSPDPDVESIPYPPDHTLTIPMRPKQAQ